MADRRQYYREYYQKNRARINALRLERYRRDRAAGKRRKGGGSDKWPPFIRKLVKELKIPVAEARRLASELDARQSPPRDKGDQSLD